MKMFVLHHTYGTSPSETYKLLGVFGTRDKAMDAIRRASGLPGFKDYPEGFSIDAYVVDESSWKEGFGVAESRLVAKDSGQEAT